MGKISTGPGAIAVDRSAGSLAAALLASSVPVDGAGRACRASPRRRSLRRSIRMRPACSAPPDLTEGAGIRAGQPARVHAGRRSRPGRWPPATAASNIAVARRQRCGQADSSRSSALARREGRRRGRRAGRIRPSLRRGLQEVMWAGGYVGTVVPPPATSLLNAPQYLTGKVLGDAAAAYIKGQLGGKAKVVLLTQDSLEFLAPRFVAMRDALKDIPGVTIVADISPQPGQQGGRLRDDEHHPPGASRRRCRARRRYRRARRAGGAAGRRQGAARPVSRRHRRRAGSGRRDQEGRQPLQEPASASSSPVFGYAMGQHAADWLEGKSIPQAMDILPSALTVDNIAQYEADLADPGGGLCGPEPPRCISQDVRQYLLRHARPVREFPLVV